MASGHYSAGGNGGFNRDARRAWSGGVEAMKEIPDTEADEQAASVPSPFAPAEHGQKRVWTISRFRKPNTTWVEVLGDIEPPPWALESEQVEVVPAADNRALMEALERILHLSQTEMSTEIVRMTREIARTALDRIQEGKVSKRIPTWKVYPPTDRPGEKAYNVSLRGDMNEALPAWVIGIDPPEDRNDPDFDFKAEK